MASLSQARPRCRSPRGGRVSPVNGRFYKGGRFMPIPPAGPDVVDLMGEPEPAPVKLSIYGFVYTARPIDPGESGTVAFELHRLDTNHHYHVIRDSFGVVKCDCGDYLFRREGTGQLCKHGAALVARGMVPAPSPVATTLAPRVFLSSTVSVAGNEASDYLPARRGRFVPTPEEMAEAAELLADLAGAY